MATAFRAGPMDCVLVEDGELGLPAELMFAGAPAGERAAAFADRADPVVVPDDCLLIRDRGLVALVDTGIGRYPHSLGRHGGELVAALAGEGVAPTDVNLLIITHGHLDHIGGLCADGRPLFPAARHLIARVEFESRMRRDDRIAAEQLPPLQAAGLLELVDAPVEPVPGLRLVPAPGHTPGHLAVELAGTALFVADAIVDSLHVEHPDWTMAFDDDPATNIDTRRALLGRAADEGLLVAASHLRTARRVERTDVGFRFRGG